MRIRDSSIQEQEECKEKLKLNKDYKYIGFASRIEANKGYDIYLRFIKELEKDKKIGDYRFLIIGTGSEEKKLNSLIKDLNLEKYVEVRSMLEGEDLLYFYNSIDAFIFPTYRRSESLGLVGLEAMSCGTFVIASDNYGPSSYVKNNKNKSITYRDIEQSIVKRIMNIDNKNSSHMESSLQIASIISFDPYNRLISRQERCYGFFRR